jgi:hypothetical protein
MKKMSTMRTNKMRRKMDFSIHTLVLTQEVKAGVIIVPERAAVPENEAIGKLTDRQTVA